MDKIKVERAIDGLTEWRKHVQTNSDIDRDISTAIDALKAQLSSEYTTKGTTSDLISRQDAIEKFAMTAPQMSVIRIYEAVEILESMQTIQPVATDINVGDKISKFIDGLEETFAYIREREGGDSVCGLCEYDGAYVEQSGNWCNECPGFDRDDCFKLSDETRKKWTEEIIKALSTIQTEERTEKRTETHACDSIGRQAAIDALARIAREKFNLSDEYNHYLAGLMDGELAIKNLPPAQPELHEGEWIVHLYKVGVNRYECDACHARCDIVYPYCPYCGEKKEGERDAIN